MTARTLALHGISRRFGEHAAVEDVSFEVAPGELLALIGDKDPAKAQRATQAMLQMSKIDLAAIEQAHHG